MTYQTDGIACMIISVSVYVHIVEVDFYSGDQKTAFTFRIVGFSLKRGSKPAKIARGDRGVFRMAG